jgi:hypothetical protein
MQEENIKGDDVDQTAVVSPASKKGEGHTLRAMMEAARRGPIADNGLSGQPSYRLYPAPVMTGTPSGYNSSQPAGGREKASKFGIDRHKTFSFGPSGPDDTGDFISEGDGGFVVPAGLFDTKRPGSEAIRRLESFGVTDNGSGSVDEEHSQVTVAVLGDFSEAAMGAAGAFSGSEAEVAGEMACGGKTMNATDKSDECGSG